MLYTKLFVPTLREDPSDAEAVSHKLMIRAGFIRQLASGLYMYLPLAWRVLRKINAIMKEEMDKIGCQEISLPVLQPADIWQQTGRWFDIKDEMFRLKDRTGRDMCLGMTHEEIMTYLASHEIRSYRHLPQMWYQIQTKLRDEARPKSGVLRTREFLMKDSYSFDRDDSGLNQSYALHEEAYKNIFSRCGLAFHQVLSDTGMMGGAGAHEFMAASPAGEDIIALCEKCGYAANVEVAESVPPKAETAQWEHEKVHTPDVRTVKEVSEFLEAGAENFIKSLLMIADGKPVLALVRGDRELHEKKLTKIIGEFRPASKDEVLQILGVEAGFIGPEGQNLPMYADLSLRQGVFISGANKKDHHTRGIVPDVHFKPVWCDIQIAQEGDLCTKCGGELRFEQCIEIGNIFKLGTKYSTALKANYLDEQGEERPIVMGSYGIGPARIAAAAIEQNHDKDGMIWPRSIAPFDVHVIPLNTVDAETMRVSGEIYETLKASGVDALFDDRDERAGVKFKDADLIGIPYRIIIGERNLKQGVVEVKNRKTGNIIKLRPDEAADRFKEC